MTFIEELDWLWRCFVNPPGHGRASDILETYRTLLLDGAPGSGRIATAKILLRELSSSTERFHELAWEEENGRFRLEPASVGDDDRVWLDLSRADERAWRCFQGELSSLRKMVVEHAALLVIVLPDKGREVLWPEFGRFHSRIGRPPPQEVLRRYLRLAGVPGAVSIPPPDFLKTERPVREIAKFADLVVSACKNAPEASCSAWYQSAEGAYTGHGTGVAEAVKELRHGPQRALLLATAMLHNAHVDHIHDAAVALLDVVGYPDERHSLERADLVTSLGEIDAVLDVNGHVRFKELRYDAAVRALFWHHMPRLRDGIQRWVGKMIDDPSLPDNDRYQLAERFADQCLHPRYRQALVESVAEWTKGPMTYRRQMAADRALRRALTAEEHGMFFRKQIYNWARDNHLSEPLAQVIIRMCTEVIAVTHPDQAVVRLHHRARRESRSTNARTSLLEMVAGDPWLRRLLLVRLTRLPMNGKGRPIDAELFLDFADPAAFTALGSRDRPLVAEAEVRAMLIEGWKGVFRECAETAWQERLRQWLITAFHDDRHRDLLVDILIDGSEQRGEILGRLYTEARGLSRSAEDDRKRSVTFLNVVLRKICTAQGIQVS
ncbi:hypothetical protein [Nonomuraea dietziae]|uniref:hypothetical protein n=1 Tax=Nonomuraea dietziae TaxID=65515 RepID=UPI003425FEA7